MRMTANEALRWAIAELNELNPADWAQYDKNFFANQIEELTQALDRRDKTWTWGGSRYTQETMTSTITWKAALYHAASQLKVLTSPSYRMSESPRFRKVARVVGKIAVALKAERPEWMAASWPHP